MPNTLKRNYPYPALQGEPPNIPLALENLANAVEADLEKIAASVPGDTVAQLESRASLLEGRVSRLENKRPQTWVGSLVLSFSERGESSSSTTVPFYPDIAGMLSVEPKYHSSGFEGVRTIDISLSLSGNRITVSSQYKSNLSADVSVIAYKR